MRPIMVAVLASLLGACAPHAVAPSAPTSDTAALCDGVDPGMPGYPVLCSHAADGHCKWLAWSAGLQADENPLDDHGAECIASSASGAACPDTWGTIEVGNASYCARAFNWCEVDNPDCV